MDHATLVAALKKPGADIIKELTPEKADAWHMASAALGETGELLEGIGSGDCDNLTEEFGDIEFYVQGVRSIFGIVYNPPDADYMPSNSSCLDDEEAGVIVALSKINDIVKKWVIYNKPIDLEALNEAFREYEFWMQDLRDVHVITRQQVLSANIAKLTKRYPNLNYSNEAAQERADKS